MVCDGVDAPGLQPAVIHAGGTGKGGLKVVVIEFRIAINKVDWLQMVIFPDIKPRGNKCQNHNDSYTPFAVTVCLNGLHVTPHFPPD